MSLAFVMYEISAINRQIVHAEFLQIYSTLSIKGFNRIFYPSVSGVMLLAPFHQ
jgi:hypothetical protein